MKTLHVSINADLLVARLNLMTALEGVKHFTGARKALERADECISRALRTIQEEAPFAAEAAAAEIAAQMEGATK